MIQLNADGTITRNYNNFPSIEAISDPAQNIEVLSKDVPVNQSKNTWVRIFLHCQALDSSSKLPIIVYIHGGGFVHLSPATDIFHNDCSTIATQLPCVIVSVKYRLAPEHRLPAAYDDAIEALNWIKTTQEEWLQKYVNYSSCFLIGSSSGGNMTYHVGLRIATQADNLLPLKIKGLILHKPFFGGVKRSESELRLGNGPGLSMSFTDLLWKLALPIGVDRDHEYCNPTVGGMSELLGQIRLQGWKVMVIGGYKDPLIDRQIELVKMMEEKGVKVESHFDQSGHRMDDPMRLSHQKSVHAYIKNFVLSSFCSSG